MANHFSALKRAKQTAERTERNRAHKSRLRSALRQLRESIAAGDLNAAQANFNSTASVIDQAVRKGVIHDNTAARYKSRLSKRLKAVTAR